MPSLSPLPLPQIPLKLLKMVIFHIFVIRCELLQKLYIWCKFERDLMKTKQFQLGGLPQLLLGGLNPLREGNFKI